MRSSVCAASLARKTPGGIKDCCSLHYQRCVPAYWQDRLLRLQALGCNTVSVSPPSGACADMHCTEQAGPRLWPQFYVPWNVHETAPGTYTWEGSADVEAYLGLIQKLGMHALLRLALAPARLDAERQRCARQRPHQPCCARIGPYICAETDFGGLPWWLASSQVTAPAPGAWPPALAQRCRMGRSSRPRRSCPAARPDAGRQPCVPQVPGGRNMTLRSDDPQFLRLVDRWWGQLLPRMQPFLVENGGPVLTVQASLLRRQRGCVCLPGGALRWPGPARGCLGHPRATCSIGVELTLGCSHALACPPEPDVVQIENELGFLSGSSNQPYLRHLLATVRQHLGPSVVVTTVVRPRASCLHMERACCPVCQRTQCAHSPEADTAARPWLPWTASQCMRACKWLPGLCIRAAPRRMREAWCRTRRQMWRRAPCPGTRCSRVPCQHVHSLPAAAHALCPLCMLLHQVHS